MSLILSIETATETCSVALSENGNLLALRESFEPKVHATALNVFIDELFKQSNKEIRQLSAVAVSSGPGSYTGLRIGVASAKGICYALDIPLIAVSTLQAYTAHFILSQNITDTSLLFCPMLDARRMEVYTAIYNQQLNLVEPVIASVLDENSYSNQLQSNRILFFGSGASKTESLLKSNPNALFNTMCKTSAIGMISLAHQRFEDRQFEDVAYFEPLYLKEFVAGPASKQL